MSRPLATILVFAAVWTTRAGAEDTYDRLVLAAGRQHLPGAAGNSASVDFVRSTAGKAFSIGAQSTSVADDAWHVARASGHEELSRGVDLFGGLDLGPGTTDNESYTYTRLLAGATIPIIANWRAVAQDTFIDVEPLKGHLISVGANVRLHTFSAQFDIARSSGGTIDQRSADLRIDVNVRKFTVLAGGLVGESNNRLLVNLPGVDAQTTTLQQVFAGATLPLGKLDMTVTVDVASSGGVRRQSVSLVLGVPLVSR